jgi:UDP-N-acetylmuramate dehydrogenase
MRQINQTDRILDYCRKTGCIVKKNESLKDYTTFKIGGTANLVVFPGNKEILAGLVGIIKEHDVRYYILGNGSNVLVSDGYFDGAFIILPRVNGIEVCGGEFIYADCGASLNRIACIARDHALSGLEFAYGIPGTLGGAVYMNAGAYGGQMSDVVYSTRYLDLDTLEDKIIGKKEHGFGYRRSVFSESDNKLILSMCLELKHGEKSKEEIDAAMQANMAARKEKQPLDYPSAGSAFKRGEDFFTAQLIDECGLKGFAVGGAQVSEKHAGFIVNKGGAKSSDVMRLIEHVKSVVLNQTGKVIECEIKIVEF